MGDSRLDKRADSPKESSADASLSLEANGRESNPLTHRRHKSYLERGVDLVSSLVVSDSKLREQVDHYACEFAKTACLFTKGSRGVLGTFLVYGLSQATPDTKFPLQAADFTLGGLKGETMKALFEAAGHGTKLVASKGVLMGMASRTTESVFQRDALASPTQLFGRLNAALFDRQAWLVDGLMFAAGEGVFACGNSLTRGAISRSPQLSGMFMGGSFGAVNGATGEVVRQRQAGEEFDLFKVIQKSSLQAGVDAAAAKLGMSISNPVVNARFGGSTERKDADSRFDEIKNRLADSLGNLRRLANSEETLPIEQVKPEYCPEKPVQSFVKDFIISEGKDVLKKFQANKVDGAMLTVRELSVNQSGLEEFGPLRKLFVQRFRIGDKQMLPEAQGADLYASCFPENLSATERQKHVFADGHGRVWLQTGSGERLRLTSGWHPVTEWRNEGYKPPYRLDGGNTTISAMAPLLVGKPEQMASPESKAAWDAFDRDLAEAKRLGLDSISTDVWWSVIEPKKGEFNWSYYEKIADRIINAGLKWTPILSFHRCDGNVGDDVTVPVPEWVWQDLAVKLTGGNPDGLKYVSEQGRSSKEYISVWATELALDHYINVMKNFQEHFSSAAPHIAEINISLGPAGELRYPSYNVHDDGTGYPSGGALQCYSELARESFRKYVLTKYGSSGGAAKAWGLLKLDNIAPPDDARGFFARNDHLGTQYGRDFVDWYSQSLLDHGNLMMSTALKVFAAPDAPFAGIDLGAKIPGVHWRIGEWLGDKVLLGDRLAEVTAGLIRTSRGDWSRAEDGFGYRDLLAMFRDLQPIRPGLGTAVVPSMTCIEMPDGQDGPIARAMPRTLAVMVGQEAERQHIWMKAENALAGNLRNPQAWERMRSLLDLPEQNGYYHGVTLLRLSDVVHSDIARAKLAELIHAIRSVPPKDRKVS